VVGETRDIEQREAPQHDEDARELAELGYESRFSRGMSLWANFSVGFTYLSPVVGIYALFAFAVLSAGPPAVWSLVIAGAGQFLVALVFAEVVSQYPIAGGVYPWARRLSGKRWAWLTGWIYAWALLITVASVAYAAGPFAAFLLDTDATKWFVIICALILIAVGAVINMTGTRNLSRAARIGFTTEIIGALIVGLYLILFERHHGFGIFFDGFGSQGNGTYIGAFLAAALIGLYQYYGFEACGDVAEEVPNPGKRIPKAMQMTIIVGGSAAILVFVGYALAVPNMGAVISGKNADPIGGVLTDVFGSGGSKVVLAIVMVSFVSCVLALQAAASRIIYSYGRDHMIAGSRFFGSFHDRLHAPLGAVTTALIIPSLVILGSAVSTDALTKIISFAVLGIYIAFQMVVLAALVARLRGWRPRGKFTLGRLGLPVNIAALTYGIAASVNVAWPRTPDVAWYDNWIVLLSTGVVVALGLIYMTLGRPWGRSTAPAGDAVPAAAVTLPGHGHA
jgi:amino acid transporter